MNPLGKALGCADAKGFAHNAILVVEDEDGIRSMLAEFLRTLGYTVLTAENADAAIKVWREQRAQIAAVITDVVMPGRINGIELAAMLELDQPGLPIIVTSGYVDEHHDAIRRCPKPFVPKPYSPTELVQILRSSFTGIS